MSRVSRSDALELELIQSSGDLASHGRTDFALTAFQIEAIKTTINTNTTIVSLKTGGGKTYIFKVAEVVLSRRDNCSKKKVTIIISPLIALIKQQVSSHVANTAIHLLSDMTVSFIANLIEHNSLHYIYCCPETITQKFILELERRELLNIIVIDEAHLTVTCNINFRPGNFLNYSDYIKLVNSSIVIYLCYLFQIIQTLSDGFLLPQGFFYFLVLLQWMLKRQSKFNWQYTESLLQLCLRLLTVPLIGLIYFTYGRKRNQIKTLKS